MQCKHSLHYPIPESLHNIEAEPAVLIPLSLATYTIYPQRGHPPKPRMTSSRDSFYGVKHYFLQKVYLINYYTENTKKVINYFIFY